MGRSVRCKRCGGFTNDPSIVGTCRLCCEVALATHPGVAVTTTVGGRWE